MKHDLLVVKLGTYGFQKDALYCMKSYSMKRPQRVRVNSNFRTWERIISGVPPSSILGSLLLNIYLNDLFLFVENSDLSNYVDGNNLNSSGNNLETGKTNSKERLSNCHKMVSRKLYGTELG